MHLTDCRRGRAHGPREAGSILISVVFTALLLGGMAVSFVAVNLEQTDGVRVRLTQARAFQIAESGIDETVNRLRLGAPVDVDEVGAVTRFDGVVPAGAGESSGEYDAAVTFMGNGRLALVSRSSYGLAGRDAVEVVIQENVNDMRVRVGATVTAHGNVSTLGNITVDGRDHDYDGALTGGAGSFGIASGGTVSVGGSSTVGGNGNTPVKNPTDGTQYDGGLKYGNNIDDDHDGRKDEEKFDRLDDDGDGRIDEDLAAYPPTPDAFLGVPEGTLERVAKLRSTYFDSQAEWSAFLSANHGVPGGAVIYLDFDSWSPADFGTPANDPPSILVLHNARSDSLMKNLHGQFRGLLMADRIEHINGDYRILGAIVSFAPIGFSHTFGNGNARLYLSEDVLSRLPSVTEGGDFAVSAWRNASSVSDEPVKP